MKTSDLLFLMIAIIYIPHERSCVITSFLGFDGRPQAYKDCFTRPDGEMSMYLDRAENFNNLPSHIVCQYKCPYFVGHSQLVIKGPKDGSWMVGHSIRLRLCDTFIKKPSETAMNAGIYCYTLSKGVYIIYLNPPMFYTVRNCNLRVFLADVATIGDWPAIVDYRGMKGMTNELRLQKFKDEPTYSNKYDYLCEKFHTPLQYPSVNSAPDKRPRTDKKWPKLYKRLTQQRSCLEIKEVWTRIVTSLKIDVLLMFCGLAMANGVLSF